MSLTNPEDATLLSVLIHGFEKNEQWYGFHPRVLPLPDEATAVAKFRAFSDEGRRWKGEPVRTEENAERRLVAWDDLEIRQAGHGVMVLPSAPGFDAWWHEAARWEDDPMGSTWAWLTAEH